MLIPLLETIPQVKVIKEDREVKVLHEPSPIIEKVLLQVIYENDISVASLSFQQNTLENIFTEVTQK